MTDTAGLVPTAQATAAQPATIPAPSFADPTRESQAVFRAILDALAHPTRSYSLAGPATAPALLGPALGAVALTVLDEDSTVWLGGALANSAEVAGWLDFHTGARRVTDAAAADFAFVTPDALPALAALRLGTDETPHLSTTAVLDVRGIECESSREAHHFTASGPGIETTAELDAPWAERIADFPAQWRANGAAFPRGVDLLLVDDEAVSALPRTTRLAPVAAAAPAPASDHSDADHGADTTSAVDDQAAAGQED
jgi:alpha-D-ribose 1-methylphosphonate 5-triphosphate synthase subunit PhnH